MRISDWSSDVCSSDLFDWTLDGCGSMPFETRGRGMAFVRDGDVNTLARPLRAAQMIPIALAQQLLVDLAGRGQRHRREDDVVRHPPFDDARREVLQHLVLGRRALGSESWRGRVCQSG